ncbi:MAG: agmatine deiminase family protein [Pseudomonadota bacterium]
MRILFGIVTALVIGGCSESASLPSEKGPGHHMGTSKELIVVAAVGPGDDYYTEAAADIFAFHVAYGLQVLAHDDFLILVGADKYAAYADALGERHVVLAPQDDIWLRDFSLSDPAYPVMFRYTAEGQGGGRRGQRNADRVQEILAEVMEAAGLRFAESDLLNDGGNYVGDGDGRVVVSRKFLRDNALTEEQGRAAIREETGARFVAFIEADEQAGLEHADGVVAFVEPGVLVVNAYPDDPDFAATLEHDLRRGLPGVEIHRVATPYARGEVYDDKFGSACGLYTNMLVTPHRIYLPQFGIAQDREVISFIGALTDKTIVPVRSDTVCYMGGGVRCMSWQLRGENAAAFKRWARGQEN